MSAAKKLAGLNAVGNGTDKHFALRAMLIILSAMGVVTTAALTGVDINLDSITTLATMFVDTLVSAYLSHAVYKAATTE
jgi:hypothetical protein